MNTKMKKLVLGLLLCLITSISFADNKTLTIPGSATSKLNSSSNTNTNTDVIDKSMIKRELSQEEVLSYIINLINTYNE